MQDLGSRTVEWLDREAARLGFSGCVLAARRGGVVVQKAFGMANVELGVPNTMQTKFRIASLTKGFTAAAVLLLCERGKLNVGDRLSVYVDDCPDAWRDVTLHHLLCHSSGIPNFLALPRPAQARRLTATAAQNLEPVRERPLEFAPGSAFKYSNSGYLLLGMVIEGVAGVSYAEFMEQQVLAPLGMNDSGYDRNERIVANRAAGYTLRDGRLENADFHDMSNPFSAGGLLSTAEDLYRWDRALGTDELLGARSRAAMFEAHVEVRANVWYGYGWELGRDGHGRPCQRHAGSITGFSSFLVRYPEEDGMVCVVSNVEDARVDALADGLAGMVFRAA